MSVLLITGPPASGKNTIGEMVAKRRERCAAVHVDLVRQMIVSPAKNPWEGEEGLRQQELAVRNTISLARNFDAQGFDVVVADVITDSTLELYKRELTGLKVFTVLLIPSEDEISARMLSRPDYLSLGEMYPAYDQQAKFLGYDEKIDNTELSPDDATARILEHWAKASA